MTARRLLPAVAAVCCLSAAAAPAMGAGQGRLVFSRPTFGAGADIVVAAPDGSGEHLVPLGDRAEDFAQARWAPGLQRLLISNVVRFDVSGDLLPFRPATVAPDGAGYTLLDPPGAPFDAYCATWAQGASRILCGFGGDSPGVFSIRSSDGGDPVRLTTNPYGSTDVATDVSPAGDRFVFVRTRPGPSPDAQPFRSEQAALFVADLDGSHPRRLTPYGFASAHEIASARWSPDGTRILSTTAQGGLFTVTADGSRITRIVLRITATAYSVAQPDWSPDGSRIVFDLFRAKQPEDLFTAKADGSDVRQITDTQDVELSPDWSS